MWQVRDKSWTCLNVKRDPAGKRKAASLSNLCGLDNGASKEQTLVVEELPDAMAPTPFSEIGASLLSRASAPALHAPLEDDCWPALPHAESARLIASHRSAQSMVGASPLDIIGTARRLISTQTGHASTACEGPPVLIRRASSGPFSGTPRGPSCPSKFETRVSRQVRQALCTPPSIACSGVLHAHTQSLTLK